MKILTLLSTFPPHSYGGGEISALNLSRWMQGHGHEVGVVTAADKNEPELHGEVVEDVQVWRLRFPRPYTFWNHVKASKWQKPLWYLQDHFDPRNRTLMGRVLDEYKPDIVSIHVPAGIGYNSLRAIGERNIPAVYFLHDLSLACLWGGMFKDGKICETQCGKCRIASKLRYRDVSSIPHVGFCSPSRANLETAKKFLPLDDHQTAAIFNANAYPVPSAPRRKAGHVRFLYVGRLSDTKGVKFLLTILEKLSALFPFTIDLLGDGAEADFLRQRFGHHAWCHFHGHVTQQQVADAMGQSDALFIPSIWPENLPGVVIHALTLGLPVVGSDVGGIPELIEDNKNGRLVAPNDAAAWEQTIAAILGNPSQLGAWGSYAKSHADHFSAELNGQKILSFMQSVIAEAKGAKAAS